MFILNRLFQYLPKLCAATVPAILSLACLAQDPAASESSASSAASSAVPEKPIYANNLERDNALFAKAFTDIAKADELQPLETPDEKIISLYKAGETRKPKGVLLIMHSPEVPQLWPAPLESLRRNLPLYGWATMALPLPARYPGTVPERELASSSSQVAESASSAASSAPAEAAASSSSASSEAAKPLIARDKLISERVEAAVAQLNKIGQFNLVVLVDNSSAPDALATLYKKINKGNAGGDTIDGPLQALILVNMQDQEPLTKEQLKAIFAVADLPVMDVFLNPDNPSQSEIRRLHQAEAMRQNLKDYQQLILPNQPLASVDDSQNFWLGKVHGFAARKAEGNELSGGDKTGNMTQIK